jgi:hypothetical protein
MDKIEHTKEANTDTQSTYKHIIEEIEEDFEFEGTRGDSPFLIHMAAGSMAGLMEHVAIYPIDTIKVKIYILY